VPDGELHGVDIDRPSIDWLRENASPPFQVACVDEEPGLPYADGSFDFVYALSVFTHIVEHWAGWLLELRRVLASDGVLIASLIAMESAEELGLSRPKTDAPGMYAVALGNTWDHGGPVTMHDEAWIAERWGRAFEILRHTPRATGVPWPHDLVTATPRAADVTDEDLLAPGPDGEAEGLAQRAQLELLRSDSLARRRHFEGVSRELVDASKHARAGVEARVDGRIAELSARRARASGAGAR
jgi:SAM-dependent methyltransferase